MKPRFWSLVCTAFALAVPVFGAGDGLFTLEDRATTVAIDARGNLVALTHRATGHNYAAGKPLWRLYYDRVNRRDNEVLASAQAPTVTRQGDAIVIDYTSLTAPRETIQIKLRLTITLVEGQARFASTIVNAEPHSVVRELHYPLVGDCRLPERTKLLTTWWGGQLYDDPKAQIRAANAGYPPYYPPSQHFLQMDQKYPQGLASNCFALVGPTQGLYVGSHDPTFEDTGHGLRLYPSTKFNFDQLEFGIYKYPSCLAGETWTCAANVLEPYSGDWHATARIYRAWADTWWRRQEPPQWVKELKGWQRFIVKHQYGEQLFTYGDIGGRVAKIDREVGIGAAFIFGWHTAGMDNDYPNYSPDPEQGGAEALKRQIAEFQKGGGAALLYFNGRLIDKASDYFRNGDGKLVCVRDNSGSEANDSYLFRGPGTFTGSYDSRTFTVADVRQPKWQAVLHKFVEQAVDYGAKSVFFDQMGWGDKPHWDLSREFPVPNLRTAADKAVLITALRDHVKSRGSDLALGVECLADVIANRADYVHARYGATDVLNRDWEARKEKPRTNNFIDWFRYTFPEIILSDRDLRDDTDVERRVNHTVLKGLRNDVEIYRCRDLIDQTPTYYAHLTKVNRLKERFKDLLLVGRYTDTVGFTHTNPEIDARRFENGDRAAIVLAQSHLASATTSVPLPPGYGFVESGGVGDVKVEARSGAVEVTLPKHGLAVVVLKKTSGPTAR